MPATFSVPEYFSQVQNNYDKLSRFYDRLSGKLELKILKQAIAMLKNRKIKRLLDIGCATGRAFREYEISLINTSLLTGIDLSFGMCLQAGKKNHNILCANGLGQPFQSDAFDAVVYSFSLEIFPDYCMAQALGETTRILKPNGVVCAICMAESQRVNLMDRIYRWAHCKFPQLVDCRPIDAGMILRKNDLIIMEKEHQSLWGLSVDIILAKAKLEVR